MLQRQICLQEQLREQFFHHDVIWCYCDVFFSLLHLFCLEENALLAFPLYSSLSLPPYLLRKHSKTNAKWNEKWLSQLTRLNDNRQAIRFLFDIMCVTMALYERNVLMCCWYLACFWYIKSSSNRTMSTIFVYILLSQYERVLMLLNGRIVILFECERSWYEKEEHKYAEMSHTPTELVFCLAIRFSSLLRTTIHLAGNIRRSKYQKAFIAKNIRVYLA